MATKNKKEPKAEVAEEVRDEEVRETVNLDTELANKGTYAVGVQAMMRERIQGK